MDEGRVLPGKADQGHRRESRKTGISGVRKEHFKEAVSAIPTCYSKVLGTEN